MEDQQKEGRKRQFSLSDIFSGLFGKSKKNENENENKVPIFFVESDELEGKKN